MPASGEGKHKSSFLTDFALGGVSAAVAKTATAPIERVKLLIQTQHANPRIRSGEIPPYSSITNCFSRVYREQGALALWRGNFTNVIRYFPTQAFNFAFKESAKDLLPKADSKKQFGKFVLINMVSGGIAGAGSLAIVYPLDYARTRLAADVGSGKRDFEGLWDCLKRTASGPRGALALYNGFGVSVLGIIPYRGVYFGLYDSARENNPFRDDPGLVGLLSKWAQAQVVTICAGYASYPFDTVRRRLQMQSEKPTSDWLYAGTRDCFRKIYHDEGFTAFYKGAWANVIRAIGAALVLTIYDQMKNLMHLH
eukprot:TRINITY_DN2191_c0_g1_i2.p1 TRINITY_DN2191_c0_g1~~TRINITY_DN2191_c0_g1_i2.p1  ORF type:complete len:310 (+),score=97.18 TRINITY_DN2191_c0_g1_i2:144-1073(+)